MLELTCSKSVGETEIHTQQFQVLVLLLRLAYGSVTPNKRHFLSHRINSIKIYRYRRYRYCLRLALPVLLKSIKIAILLETLS
jgi:hypothetical protein